MGISNKFFKNGSQSSLKEASGIKAADDVRTTSGNLT